MVNIVQLRTRYGMYASQLTRLFEQERQRVCTPGDDFCQRVMSCLNDQYPQAPIWDVAFSSMRAVAAVAAAAMLALVCFHLLTIPEPDRGFIQIYVDLEIPPFEQELYLEGAPSVELVMEELLIEGGQ